MNIAGIEAWIALQLVQGLGRTTFLRLMEQFGHPEDVWNADGARLEGLAWLRPSVLRQLLKGPDMEALSRAVKTLKRMGAWVLTIDHASYPERLRHIPDPPPLLYGIGDHRALASQSVAVVGSRKASSYGVKAAHHISEGLGLRGISVVSGMALGIDSAAHKAALEAGARTVAVLGCGIDICYPRNNLSLMREISGQGAVISEFPPGTRPDPGNFPARNRIISGISSAVVIIEAGLKSGSLITAACALEQGREVMAVPGSIFSFNSRGTHWLIKQGAGLVENASEIVEELGIEETGIKADENCADTSPPELSAEEKILWKALDAYPRHIDEVAASCDLPPASVSGLLLQMEIKDLVQALPGQMYQRK